MVMIMQAILGSGLWRRLYNMKKLLILLFITMIVSGCANKIVFISVDQEAAQENKLLLDDNVLETQDSFEADSQPVVKMP